MVPLHDYIKNALERMGISVDDVHIEHPSDESHGDYSSNVALKLFGTSGLHLDVKSPRSLAQSIVTELEKDAELRNLVSKIDIAGPGFINFWLGEEYLLSELSHILERRNTHGTVDKKKKQTIIIEFGQPNTHKLPHIGHLRSFLTGESIARILEALGNKIIRVNYQGDVGMHVAKCLWGYIELKLDSQVKSARFDALGKNIDKLFLIEWLQQAYQYGSKKYIEDPKVKKEIDELNKKIYQKDPSIMPLWENTRRISLKHYEEMYEKIGIAYDHQYFESEVAEEAVNLVHQNVGSVFMESNGAIIFPGGRFGLHNRVFITSAGNPTYEAKDLALAFRKEKDYKYDRSLISTASEQTEYFKVVYKAVDQIDKNIAKKFTHIPFGMVNLKGKKISSREGTIVSIDDYFKEYSLAYEKAGLFTKLGEKNEHHKVISGAIKYAMLSNGIGKNIICDIEESINLQGNTGPYLQYTYARCKSVLLKLKQESDFSQVSIGGLVDEELKILRSLYKFPEIVNEAGITLNPSVIAHYLFDLAQRYNLFYQNIPILKAKSKKLVEFRLSITRATAHVLKNGLNLLGIDVLEKM